MVENRRERSFGAPRMPALAAGLLACTVLASLAAGCSASENVVRLDSTADFQKVVLDADKPVLVTFWKGGCALCGILAPITDKLADEYKGRAVVADYQLVSLIFLCRNEELRDRYYVSVYPTAILFVHGKEVRRWVVHYEVNDYRKALDEYAPPTKPTTAPATKPAQSP